MTAAPFAEPTYWGPAHLRDGDDEPQSTLQWLADDERPDDN